jgi:hypothetical protein
LLFFWKWSREFQNSRYINRKIIYAWFKSKLENKDGYKRINRYADITYSGVFNSSSNVNKLNEFNLSLANFKDDIDKSYGPITK